MPAAALSTDVLVAQVLKNARRVAVLGYSRNPTRPSHMTAACLANAGFSVVGVNPTATILDRMSLNPSAAKRIQIVPSLLAATVASGLATVESGGIDIVNVFRNPAALDDVLEEITQLPVLPKAVWMQEGVADAEVEAAMRELGLLVVSNKCLLKEHIRLLNRRIHDDDDLPRSCDSRLFASHSMRTSFH